MFELSLIQCKADLFTFSKAQIYNIKQKYEENILVWK